MVTTIQKLLHAACLVKLLSTCTLVIGQVVVYSNYTPNGSTTQFLYQGLPTTNLVSTEAASIGGQSVGWGDSLAAQFTAGLSATITSVQVPLVRTGSYVDPDPRVRHLVGTLWTYDSGKPGVVVGSFSAPMDADTNPNAPGGATAVPFFPQGTIQVTQGVSYFFQVGPSGDYSWADSVVQQSNTAYGWIWAWQVLGGSNHFLVTGASEPAPSDWSPYVDNSSGTITVSRFDPYLGATVYFDVPGIEGGLVVSGAAIPEPATIALLAGLVALGLGAAVRYWQRRAMSE